LKRKDFLGDYLFNRGLYTPIETAAMLECSTSQVNSALNKVDIFSYGSIKDGRDIVSQGEQDIYMQSQLLKVTDYMGMWHSLEVRVPFLDKELLETVHSISPDIKYNSTIKKGLLIDAFRDLLPKDIYTRKKQGFTFPFEKWLIPVQTTIQRRARFIQKRSKLKSGKMQWAHYWAYMLACERDFIKYYDKPVKKILFLNLDTFRFTGGIEKFNRAFLKALKDLETDGKLIADSLSAYDNEIDNRYFNPEHYKGYNGNRINFVLAVWKAAKHYDSIIVGHINLSFAAWGIKKLFPNKEIVLVTHGIEVWETLKGAKGFIMQAADTVLAVSAYTKDAIVKIHKLPESKISIFHNTIDPFFSYPVVFEKPKYLMDRYGLTKDDSVVFTLTRLSASEKYKGYDKIVSILPELKNRVSDVKYILSGKADAKESKRLVTLQKTNKLSETVLLTGFIKDEEVVDHFLLADVFIMPSRKEGFGIVFIEAMACGLPVIAGNKDGSVDALQQGALGTLVNPDEEREILEALECTLLHKESAVNSQRKLELQGKVNEKFGFDVYKKKLEKLIA
jgi:glycosyltransferase involved in cell wall biosynthesis